MRSIIVLKESWAIYDQKQIGEPWSRRLGFIEVDDFIIPIEMCSGMLKCLSSQGIVHIDRQILWYYPIVIVSNNDTKMQIIPEIVL